MWIRRGCRVLVVAGASCSALTLALASCGTGSSGSSTVSPSAGPIGGPSSQPLIAAKVAVGNQPDGLIYAYGSLWVANFGDGSVSRVDPASRRVVATIAAGAGAITVASVGSQIWVANFEASSVTRIDPATNKVIATSPTGTKPVAIAVVGRVAWVFCQADGTAHLWDIASGRPEMTVSLGVHAGFVTVAGGLLWVPDFQGGTSEVVAVDPVSRRIVKRVRVGAAPISVSFAAGSGWVSNTGDASVTRFDQTTGRTVATVAVSGGSIGPLLATPTAVWVSVYGGAQLADIDPVTAHVTRTISVGDEPQNLAFVSGQLWVAEAGANDVALAHQ